MKILVLKGKHGNRHFKYHTPEDKEASIRTIYESNKQNGFYHDVDPEFTALIETDPSQLSMFMFARSNQGHEYEELRYEILE